MSDAYEFELNGMYHILDRYEYYQDNVLHREDGPAVFWTKEGTKIWYYKGKYIACSTQEEFERIIKLKVFL